MEKRIYNFSAGPAILPEEVLLEAQKDLFALPGVGMSILEISHRFKNVRCYSCRSKGRIKKTLDIPDDYQILFLQGGASLQFSMVPLNLMPPKNKADYISTGSWSKKAIKEAKRVGTVNVAATTEEGEGEKKFFKRIPKQSELKLDPDAAYVTISTSNNTIFSELNGTKNLKVEMFRSFVMLRLIFFTKKSILKNTVWFMPVHRRIWVLLVSLW
ncbi:MAG: aminotransferase class V-fold PLP-dependent enzyme [Ignavibacteriaceae bacterium]|nr:aminotransferase class V-fold PLP-dependent enzyme [Ignavibacteriaceae bacterium]